MVSGATSTRSWCAGPSTRTSTYCASGTHARRAGCSPPPARRPDELAGDQRKAGLDHRARAAQLGGLHGVAAEGGAVRLEVAVVAQRPGMGPEVLALTSPQDRRPQGVGTASDTRDRLLGGGGDDRLGL